MLNRLGRKQAALDQSYQRQRGITFLLHCILAAVAVFGQSNASFAQAVYCTDACGPAKPPGYRPPPPTYRAPVYAPQPTRPAYVPPQPSGPSPTERQAAAMEQLRNTLEQTSEALRNLPSGDSSQGSYSATPPRSGNTDADTNAGTMSEDAFRRQREEELRRQAVRDAAQRALQAKQEDDRRRKSLGNPFSDSAGRGAGANPFSRGPSGGDQSCIPDLQRAMLDLKRAYLSNFRNAVDLNRIDVANYETPFTPCPPPAYAGTMTQRQTMDAAASAQACGVQAVKCAIARVSAGGDCQQAVAYCKTLKLGAQR